MHIKRCEVVLKNLQIKSLRKAKKLARALEIIEEECGIHEVRITIIDSFVCPWINLNKLSKSEMEKLLRKLLKTQFKNE